MEISDVGEAAAGELIEVIRRVAAAYTPEWHFDTEHPDIGTALALLFADMMSGTREQFAGVPGRCRLRFYELLGAEQLPPKEAGGYVTFTTVSDEVNGAFLEAGERLQGGTPDGRTVVFETRDGLYVSPARLRRVLYADGDADRISGPLDFPLRLREEGRGGISSAVSGQSHVLYIGQDTLFSIDTEGELEVDLHLPPDEWDRWPGRQLLEQAVWSYSGREGFVQFAGARYEEGRVFLHKDVTQPAAAQTELHGVVSRWIRAEVEAIPPQSFMTCPALSMRGAGNSLVPESIFDGELELVPEDFLPFGERPYPFAGVYICSEEVLSKKGASVELEFDLSFEKIPGEIKSVELPVNWRNIMHQSQFEKPEPPDIMISGVIWEYYNGSGWRRLSEAARYGRIFDGSAAEEHVSLRFLCPEDIYPFLLAGREACCIRIRVTRMDHLYEPDGVYITPRIKGLCLSYRYEGEGVYPSYAFGENQKELVPLMCRGGFIPFYSRLPAGRMLGLCFSAPLKERGIKLLFLIQRGSVSEGGPYRFEYYGRDGWQPLRIEDETGNLSHTGLVTLSVEHEFERREIGDASGYWIRIVRREGDFPVIRKIILNAVMASACDGSGRAGNLSAGAVNRMERNIGFINEVSNPEEMAGGCEEETDRQAVSRFAASLRHRGRAVTAKDFEDIVYGSVRNVSQVRCFPGRDETGKRMPGHITLAVLAGPEGTGERFEYLEHDILQCLRPYMDGRLCGEGRLHIVEPVWVPFSLYMTAAVGESARLGTLREKIERRINEFLDPVNGNFDGHGWGIGTLPTVLQIENLCGQMKEILYIRNISLRAERDYGKYVLAAGGEHEIELEGGSGHEYIDIGAGRDRGPDL